jgi:tetratricopeptide (TPR) repeat protein
MPARTRRRRASSRSRSRSIPRTPRRPRASQHEAAGELAEARARYVEARDLDPASTRAKEGIARMDARLGEIAYGRGMSGATRALAAGDFESALRSVKAALAARPGSAEASALRARIEAGRKRSQAELHQSRGLALERDGSWALAVDEYRKSLAIDPDAAAAQQGLARSEQGLRLSRSFAEWIAAPDRLIDPRVRTQASELLAAARAFPSAGDELRAQARQVEALVARYSQPVRVVFESDDQTEVTIQRLSKLGSFTRREVELDPGTYVVIGIRRGYRDVRETITVAPGEASPRVVIRCTQPI